MRCTEPGHTYELELVNEDHLGVPPVQTLQFMHKEEKDGELVLVTSGTTNEDVLRVLIDRMEFLNGKVHCSENAVVIKNLKSALLWLEKRTSGREARCVEGTPRR